jgi:diaminohydroxyphosphoribosylaminopyrimidine deaminase/5-amino-6-(5-phosphoribosylamino)uracil reductase
LDLARRLAERGRFTVAPNPLVGAVVVRDETVVGEGWHARAGEAHAEVRALEAAGEAARGATLFVTLEPCNHHGRTPPCVEAVLRAGVNRVVVGTLDENPLMRGKSVGILREAGIEVEVLEEPALADQNEQYLHYMRTGRPFVHVKLATTLDGRIAAPGGDSKWVTGEAARLRAHALRAEAGAVLVGAGTVRADDPTLTVRGLPEEPPAVTRVVLDPRLSTSPKSRLVLTAAESPVVIFASAGSLNGREDALLNAGVEVISAPPSEGGVIDHAFVLEELGRRGIKGVLVEGGGETATGFVKWGFAEKLTLFYAPKLIGSQGIPMIGALRATRMAEALRFRVSGVEVVGEDVAVTLYPAPSEEERRVYRAS